MPAGDGTGPYGQGRRRRGLGPCGLGLGRGRHAGGGGFGRALAAQSAVVGDDLHLQVAALAAQLAEVQHRLAGQNNVDRQA
jgi:hypothetical protein